MPEGAVAGAEEGTRAAAASGLVPMSFPIPGYESSSMPPDNATRGAIMDSFVVCEGEEKEEEVAEQQQGAATGSLKNGVSFGLVHSSGGAAVVG